MFYSTRPNLNFRLVSDIIYHLCMLVGHGWVFPLGKDDLPFAFQYWLGLEDRLRFGWQKRSRHIPLMVPAMPVLMNQTADPVPVSDEVGRSATRVPGKWCRGLRGPHSPSSPLPRNTGRSWLRCVALTKIHNKMKQWLNKQYQIPITHLNFWHVVGWCGWVDSSVIFSNEKIIRFFWL